MRQPFDRMIYCICVCIYIYIFIYLFIIEGSLNRNFRQYGELKSSSRVVKSVDRRCNSQKVRRKKIHPRQMLEKSRNAVFFHRLVCRVSPKVGLLKRRVRRKVPRGDIKNCTPLWRKAHFEVKMCKTRQVRSIFCSYDVAKLHAAVAKCTFGSENVKKLSCSEHFLTFYCGKIAEKLYAAVAKCTFGSENVKKLSCSEHFLTF